MNGAGAASIAITKLLISAGAQGKNIVMCDSRGIIYAGRPDGMNKYKDELCQTINPEKESGSLADAMKNADVFIGVSVPGTVTQDMVKSMAKDPIVFACANRIPEIYPDEAKAAGAKIVATGRSDFPNQINNVSAFPGIFRGTFDVRASEINDAMNVAAAHAIADFVKAEDLSADHIMPHAFTPGVAEAVAKAVAEAARKTGVARK